MLTFELKKLLGNKFLIIFFSVLFLINAGLSLYEANMAKASAEQMEPDKKREILDMFDRYRDDPEGFLQNEYQPILDYKQEWERKRNEYMKYATEQGIPSEEMNLAYYWEDYDQSKIDAYYNLYIYFNRATESGKAYYDNVTDLLNASHRAKGELVMLGKTEDSYDYGYQQDIIDIYTVNRELPLDPTYPSGWEAYFSYTGGNLCVLLFLLVLISGLLLDEKKSGTLSLIHTTKRGYIPLILTKLTALLTAVVLTVVIYSGTSLAIFGLVQGGYSPLSDFVQVFESYHYCPYLITVGEYLGLSLLIKVLMLTATGMLLLLLSRLIGSHIMTYAVSVVYVGIHFALSSLEYVNPNHPVRLLNLFTAMDTSVGFGRYYSVNLFGTGVPYMTCLTALWGAVLVIAGVAVTLLFCRAGRAHTVKAPTKKALHIKLPPVTASCFSRTLLGFEVHKLLVAGKYLLLILLILGIKIAITDDMTYHQPVGDVIYQSYMTRLEGEWTQDKGDYLNAERAAIEELKAKEESMKSLLETGEISGTEYNEYRKSLYDAKVRDAILSRVEMQESYILTQKEAGKEAHFVYATGWDALFDLKFDYLLFALLLILGVGIFTPEFFGISPIIRATGKGRRHTLVTKYALAITLALTMGILFATLDFIKMNQLYSLPAWDSPALSLATLSNLAIPMTLRGYFITYEITKLIGFTLLTVAAVSVSLLLKKAVHALAVTVLVTLLPFVLIRLGLTAAEFFDVTALLQGSGYLEMAMGSPVYAVAFTVAVVGISALCVWWSGRRWVKG